MRHLYAKYIDTLLTKMNTSKDKIAKYETAKTNFTKVYNLLKKDNTKELDYLITSSISNRMYLSNKDEIVRLMKEDSNDRMYINAIRIAKLNSELTNETTVLNNLFKHKISFDTFCLLHKDINREIENACLMGDIYHSKGLGTISIEVQSTSNLIDWNKTNELKQLLISKGIDLYDKTTGKGAKYFCYHKDGTWPFWKWHSPFTQEDSIFRRYVFTPTVKIKTNDRKMSTVESSKPSLEDIINNPKLGTSNKTILIAKCHPLKMSNYAN